MTRKGSPIQAVPSTGGGGLSGTGDTAEHPIATRTRPGRKLAAGIFQGGTVASVLVVSTLILAMVVSLLAFSSPAIPVAGTDIFLGLRWDPDNDMFGGLPFIIGTLLTASLALAISLPFSLSIAIFLGEYRPTGKISTLISSAIELLAGIPSIIYGVWGLYVVVPLVQVLQRGMADPAVIPFGLSVFTASIVLAIMIIPYSASISREVIAMVPGDLKEAGYSLGATRFSVIRRVIIPNSLSGIMAGQLLAFGRALGETMAVAMVIGNLRQIPASLFAPGASIASLIASEYNEAMPLHAAALTELGLILFLITLAFGFLGRIVIHRMEKT